MQGDIDIAGTPDAVCCILNKILMEPIVTAVCQQLGDTLSFVVESRHRKGVTRLQPSSFILVQNLLDLRIGNIVCHTVDEERLTRTQPIVHPYFLSLRTRFQIYGCMHIS